MHDMDGFNCSNDDWSPLISWLNSCLMCDMSRALCQRHRLSCSSGILPVTCLPLLSIVPLFDTEHHKKNAHALDFLFVVARYGAVLHLFSGLMMFPEQMIIPHIEWWSGNYSNYRQISNIRRIKSQTLNVSWLVLQLPLPSPLEPGIESRMKM